MLADETTLGYEDQCNLRLLKFNQQPVRNLRHLADMVYHCKEAYMRFDLECVFCPVLSCFLRLSLSCCGGCLFNLEGMSALLCVDLHACAASAPCLTVTFLCSSHVTQSKQQLEPLPMSCVGTSRPSQQANSLLCWSCLLLYDGQRLCCMTVPAEHLKHTPCRLPLQRLVHP